MKKYQINGVKFEAKNLKEAITYAEALMVENEWKEAYIQGFDTRFDEYWTIKLLTLPKK